MSAYLSLIGRRRGGRLFEAGRLFEVGANSRLGAFSNKYDSGVGSFTSHKNKSVQVL